MTLRLPVYWVDAFATRPFEGNPAAVVPLPRWLPDALLQAMAAEHNLSETAFVVPTGPGTWHLRWFTPATEVELCGHATLATAFVLATELGAAPPFAFDTLSGRLTVEREGERLVLDFPARASALAEPPPGLAEALGGAVPREVVRARDWICVFDTPEQVVALRPDHAKLAALPGPERVIATAAGGTRGEDVTSRYFAIKVGIPEDPVTGAAHVQIVPFWAARLGRNALVCRQASARGGTLWCELRGERVRMGGTAVLYAKGEALLPADVGAA